MPATLAQAKTLCASVADNGLCETDSRLVDRINEVQRRLLRHYNYLVRREEYDKGAIAWEALDDDEDELLLDDLDATKLMCLALWREENNLPEVAAALEAKAFALVQEEVAEKVEAASKAGWKYLLANADPGTYGYTRARLGLDLSPALLRYSDAKVGRLLNSAEEQLMMKRKPVGTLAEYKFDIPADGLILFPVEIEAILYAAVGASPISAPVYSQAYDFMENGPGYQLATGGNGWSAVLVARGEVSGQRQYFVRNSSPGECVRLLAKKRFIVKATDADAMTVRNYPALREMANSLAIALEDPQGAEVHEQKALRLIDEELTEHRGGERSQVGFQVRGANRPPRALR